MLHLRTVLQRSAALILTLSAVCGVVLWDKGYYDISFIPRGTGQPNETGAETSPANQGDIDSSGAEETGGTHPGKQEDFKFSDADELRSRGSTLYTGKYDAKICTAAQVRLSGNLNGIGIFSAETLSVSHTVRVQTSNQGIQLEKQTSPWSLPAIFPYMGYLFTYDGTRRGLYLADGTLLREDMPKVEFPYCRDGNDRPVVLSEGAYYAIGEDGALLPVLLEKEDTGLYFDYPAYYGTELDTSLVLFSETKRVFYRLPEDAVTNQQKYTEKQKELIEGGMTPEEALAWKEPEQTEPDTEAPVTDPVPIPEPETEPPVGTDAEVTPEPNAEETMLLCAAPGALRPVFSLTAEQEPGEGVADAPGIGTKETGVPENSGTEPAEPDVPGTEPSDTEPAETDAPSTEPSDTEPTETDVPGTEPSDTEPEPEKVQYYTTSVETLWGYKDADGNTVLEAQYFFAHPFNQNGLAAVGIYSEKLETVVLVFINREGAVKINVAGQQISRADRDYRPMYNGYYASASNDADSIGSYYFDDGYVRVRRVMVDCRKIWNTLYTKTVYSASYDEDILLDASGKEFPIPDGYTLCGYSDGILLLEKDGYYGYMSNAGNWIAQPIYTYAEPFQQGLGVIGYADGVRGMLDTDGNLVIPFEYLYISSCSRGVITAYNAAEGWSLYNLLTLPEASGD